MESRAKLFGHPIHQMLIVFPLGLLATSFLFDLLYLISGSASWAAHSHVMIGAGIIGGIIAAVFGAIDWWAIPSRTRAKVIGAMHGVGNLIVIALFAFSWIIRDRATLHIPSTTALVLSLAAVILTSITAWLGGELVNRLGVGVDEGAHLNAPSSLTHGSIHTST